MTTYQTNNPIKAHGIWALGIAAMRSLNFKAKALIIFLVFWIPMLSLSAWLLKSQTDQAMQERMNATRQHVEVAHGVIEWAHGRQASGELSLEEAQKVAKQAVSKLRYDKLEYFFINDMRPFVVMHPIRPELDGKDASEIKDPNGFALFKGFVDVVQKEKQGFVGYLWPKPGLVKPVEKLSYVKGFEPWGWVVGSGIYIDDLRDAQVGRRNFAALVVGLAFLVVLYVFICFYKVNKGGFEVLSRHLNELSEGDLRNRPNQPWGRDEPAMLILELNKVYDSMHELIRRVRHSARELAMTSDEVSKASIDLSERTEDAAANLAEQASAMEEIGSTVGGTAVSAEKAAAFAVENATVAEKGGQVFGQVVSTMRDIQASSSQIGDIIGVIDGIAFQTNILALNAAVEAARAGEQGRGFAVVATEVRTLAQRSAAAAREIKTLITASLGKVDGGTRIVQEAGGTMNEVVSSAKQINSYLIEISTSSRQQATGVAEVSRAIHQLDGNTQQNAALVEQTSAAAGALSEQARKLTEEIARFRVV